MVRPTPSALAVFGSALTLLAAAHVSAQGAPSAADQQRAAEAYDHATAAYVSRDYRQAAALFETAHRLAPASAALVQAVRSHERARNPMRAASLALQLEALYPDDRAAVRAAQQALGAAGDYLRVEVGCEGCQLQVDGGLVEHPSFFLEPDREHTIVATFETGEVREAVRGGAGETQTLALEAPPAPPEPDPVEEPEPVASPGEPEPVSPPEVSGGGGGVPVWVTIPMLVVTATLGGVLVWSGLDALDGVPAYEANPTEAGLADGRMREERTNWLIGGTAVAGAATLLLMIFTDWGGGRADTRAILDVQADGFAAGLRGAF